MMLDVDVDVDADADVDVNVHGVAPTHACVDAHFSINVDIDNVTFC